MYVEVLLKKTVVYNDFNNKISKVFKKKTLILDFLNPKTFSKAPKCITKHIPRIYFKNIDLSTFLFHNTSCFFLSLLHIIDGNKASTPAHA